MTNNVEELIVLGNGFDLKCGLNTTYENFFSITLSTLEEYKISYGKPIEFFENKIEEFLEFKHLNIREGEIFGEKYKSIPKNIWYQILLHEKKSKNIEWYQIESVILDYVKNRDLANRLAEIVLKINDLRAELTIEGVQEYDKKEGNRATARAITKVLKEVNIRDRIYILIVLTLGLNIQNKKKVKSYSELIEQGREKLREYLINEILGYLKEVENDFIKFLKDEERKTLNYNAEVNSLLYKILAVDDWKNAKYNILTFNYTFPFYDVPIKPEVHLSVHGKAISNEIIFGIDHKNIESDSLAYRFTKNYRTLQLYSENLFYKDYQNVYGRDIKIIKFYGHSLAEADYSYFQQMFDYYDLYSNNDLQLIFYYSVYDKEKEEEIRQEQFNSISKLISTYGATLDNKDKGNNLLTRLTQTGRLRLVKI